MKFFVLLLAALGLLVSSVSGFSISNVGVVQGGPVYGTSFDHGDYWSGNPGTQYIANFSVNKQISSLSAYQMPEYANSFTGFGSAAGLLYSENLNTLLDYIALNDYSINGYYFANINAGDGSLIWNGKSGQVRDLILGETVDIRLGRLSYYDSDLSSMTLDNYGMPPTLIANQTTIPLVEDEDSVELYGYPTTEYGYTNYYSYKATVAVNSEENLILSINTGPFVLQSMYMHNELSFDSSGDTTLVLEVVPETSSYALLLSIGVLGYAVWRRRN